MDNVSRPLIALLIATLAFFALWITMLKPSTAPSGPKGGTNAYQSAIAKARQTVAASDRAAGIHTTPAAGASGIHTTPAAGAAAAQSSSPSVPTVTVPSTSAKVGGGAAHNPAATTHRLNVVTRALDAHKVLALLFYNPAATDDRAVKRELASVSTHGHRVVKLAIPISELARYPVVTTQVQLNESPTLVLIDSHRQATTIVGFADRFEIAQRVQDALAVA